MGLPGAEGALDPGRRPRLERAGEEESLGGLGQVLSGRVHERCELLRGDRARDIPVPVDRVHDHEGFDERAGGWRLELDLRPRAPRPGRFEDAAEGSMLEHEKLAQVSREPADLRLGSVDADPLRPRLEQPDLRRLVLAEVAQDVVHVQRGPVHGGQALRRVRDLVAGDDLHLEALVPTPRVRMLRIHPDGALEDVPEREALLLQVLPREVRRERDEHVDLRLVQMHALRDGADENRLRIEAAGGNPLGQAVREVTDDRPQAAFLVLRRQDSPENADFNRVHRRAQRLPL